MTRISMWHPEEEHTHANFFNVVNPKKQIKFQDPGMVVVVVLIAIGEEHLASC